MRFIMERALVEGCYFTDEFYTMKNKAISRYKEGLCLHHIDEDKVTNLSSVDHVKELNAPFGYQKPDRKNT